MLTDKRLQSLKPKAKEYIIADAHGLGVRVWPSGAKTFQYRYRVNGKLERLTIGNYPEITLKEARERHAAARKQAEQGVSPAYTKQLIKGAAASAGIETVKELAAEFTDRFLEKQRKRPGHAKQMLDADVLPALGKIRVKDITRRHVVKMLDDIVDRGSPVQANRTASLTKQMFQYAVERGIIDANPCSDIRRQTIGGTEKSRDRNLDETEIKAFWKKIGEATSGAQAAEKETPSIGLPMAAALKLLLVTAQRRGELVKAKWSDISFSERTWTIPAENSKNGKPHQVPLTPLAVKLFKELKGYSGESDFVLPTTHIRLKGDTPIAERSLTKAADRAQDIVGIAKWVPHDLRRTAASQLAELGVPPHVVEKIQNHTMQGVMAVYNRYDYAKECRAALELWSKKLNRLAR
jgi:integrase